MDSTIQSGTSPLANFVFLRDENQKTNIMIPPLLPELIALQQRDHYLRHEALVELSEGLGVSINHVYSVASFYQAFRFTPRGKHHIKVCVGAACYVKGAETLFDAFALHLGIRLQASGFRLQEEASNANPEVRSPKSEACQDTSPDGLFTLSKVSCLGCCMLAVAVQIDRHIFGHVTPNRVPHVIKDFLRLSQEEETAQGICDGLPAEKFRPEVRICRCSSCRAAGSARVYKEFESQRRKGNFDFTIKEVGCHGMSYRSPLVMVVAEDTVYHYDRIREHEVKAVLANHPGALRPATGSIATRNSVTPANDLRRAVWKGKAFLDRFYRRKSCEFSEKALLSATLDDTRLVTRNSGITHPESLEEYCANGGFAAFDRIAGRHAPDARTMKPEEVIDLLERSRLRGRGGGGFPTGTKWRLALEGAQAEVGRSRRDRRDVSNDAHFMTDQTLIVSSMDHLTQHGGGHGVTALPDSPLTPRPSPLSYVVCNADEGDPGAFMDRMLLESYPYRVLEGMLIASYVLGAKLAIIYIREEYTQAIAVLEKVIASLRDAGYFKRVASGQWLVASEEEGVQRAESREQSQVNHSALCTLHSAFPTSHWPLATSHFDLILFRGAGAFVCGEETALLESIEGKRGIPRKRPPFPVTCGLNGMPTLINNVETFACVPMILADDGKAFQAIGTESSRGTKAFALAGKVRQGGLIEVPIGITIEEIVEQYGGGAEEGHTIKAVMIGGPSGGCIPRKDFDLPVDYETLQGHGAMMGSGGLVVLDERDCMVDLSLYFLRFLREESCGKCVMCREGVARLCDLVEQLTLNKQISRRDTEAGVQSSEFKVQSSEEGHSALCTLNFELLDRIESLAKHIQQGSLCALGRTAPNMVLSALKGFREEFEAHVENACPAGKCRELTNFQVEPGRCIGCTKCAQTCAARAIDCVVLESSHINPSQCVQCGVCRTVCPQQAIVNARREV